MAKLIKKSHFSGTSDADIEVTEIADPRRLAVIDKASFEARAEAQTIRERAHIQAEELLVEAKIQAEIIRSQAEQEAQALLVEAQAQQALIKKTAYDEGYQIGLQDGAATFTEHIASASVRFEQLQNNIIPQLTELALKIAKKILGRELEFHPEAVVQIVRQALAEKARQRREILLRVNPSDMQIIREHKQELVEVLSRTKEIAIQEDETVALHGVVIETDAGTIDAQLETQMAAIERVLKSLS